MSRAVIDLDFVKYSCASIGEIRSIVAIHRQSGQEKEFSNKTEFWGRTKKKDGGWLGELNAKRTSPFLPEEFDIIEKQELNPDVPIANVLHSAKMMIESSLKRSGADNFVSFLGQGDPFRVEYSTLLKYKGQRETLSRPLLLDDVSEYLKRKFKPEVVTYIECDDAVNMEAVKDKTSFIIGVDKDFYGCPASVWNYNNPDEGIVDCRGFGELWLDTKGKVRGKGRLFKYLQACSEDTTDNYKANCFSDTRWAVMSAYKALKDTENDQQAFKAMKEIFQLLYPEPKEVIGWRGEPIQIDWLYVMNECLNLAHIWRKDNDYIDTRKVLVSYELL